MMRNLSVALPVIVIIAFLSGGLVYWRADQMVEPGQIALRGLATVRWEEAVGIGFTALIFGLMTSQIYIWLAGQWMEAAAKLYLGFGVAFMAVLTLAAVTVRPLLHLEGIPEVVALNFLWGLGYGWVIPFLIRWFGSLESDIEPVSPRPDQ